MVWQASSGTLSPIWTRAAIHDTVASIVRQVPYRRDLQSTLFDRLMQKVDELLSRFFDSVRGVPHGRQVAAVAVGLLVILVISRLYYARTLRATEPEEPFSARDEVRVTGDPWSDAERLAGAGHYTEAAHALYRSVIAALAARRLVRTHSSKTSGDYARELRHRSAGVEVAFRRFGARYDRIIYGTGVCDIANYRSLRDAARSVFAVAQTEHAA